MMVSCGRLYSLAGHLRFCASVPVSFHRRTYVEEGGKDRKLMRLSGRLLGIITLVCVALGAAIVSVTSPHVVVVILLPILAVETALAICAACDPWLGRIYYPPMLRRRRSLPSTPNRRRSITLRNREERLAVAHLASQLSQNPSHAGRPEKRPFWGRRWPAIFRVG